jgi:CRISPR-associated protein Cmr1
MGLKSTTTTLTPIKIKLLTPLWTGGVEKMDRVHETSIIGSLRWWYESIIRGLGHTVCNPMEEPCNAENPCPACKLFGCTGLKRKFSLFITSNGDIQDNAINIRPYGRKRGWYLPIGFTGDITLNLYSTEDMTHIISLIHWLSEWGALGAKSQLGYGIFKITSDTTNPSFKSMERGIQPSGYLPDLRAFTFFKFHFVPHDTDWWKPIGDFQYTIRKKESLKILENLAAHTVPVSPLLKNYFRFRKKWGSYRTVNWLFGTIRTYTQKSKVNFSWAYKVQDHWEIKGWAWLPQDKRYFNKETITTLENSIANELEWLNALDLQGKVSEAKLYIEPREHAWRTKDSSTIQNWLRGGSP